MRLPSIYLSNYFLTEIWPKFSVGFKNVNTKNTYFSDICLFSEFVEKDILEVNYNDCKRYMDYLNQSMAAGKLKQSTLVKKHKELSRLFSFICSNRFRVPSTFSNFFIKMEIDTPKEEIHLSSIISITDIDMLLGYVKDTNAAVYIAVLLAFKQLLRTSEMVKLKISDIQVAKDEIPCLRIQQPSGHVRYNKLAVDVFRILNEYANTLNGMYLISKDGVKPYSVRTIQKYLSDACTELQLNKFTYNDLRNTGTVNAVSNGAPIDTVKQEIGMRTNRHITRLNSLTLNYSNASDFINIELKEKRK